MKIEKLSANCYRVRKVYKGTRYTITFDHKPTQKEVMLKMSDEIEEGVKSAKGTFKDYAQKYIELRENVVSPTTLRTYNYLIKVISDDFNYKNLFDITQTDIQDEINRYAVDHAPKTVRSLHGFISAVLGSYRPKLSINTTLPKVKQKRVNLPSNEELRRILEYEEGTEYHIPFQLGILGLRRGEICALDMSDLNGNTLSVTKTKVFYKGWHIKDTPKTEESNRIMVLPDSLVEEIRKEGKIYEGDPKKLNNELKRVQKKLGIAEFVFHDLRHYFASYCHALHIPDADILKMGGWKTDHVMKNVYRDSMSESLTNSLTTFLKNMP